MPNLVIKGNFGSKYYVSRDNNGYLAAILKNGCISLMQQMQKKHLVDYLPQGCTKLNSTINFSRPQNVYGIIRQGRSICFVNINTLRQYTYCRAVEKEIHSNNFDLNPNVGMHNSLNGEYTH